MNIKAACFNGLNRFFIFQEWSSLDWTDWTHISDKSMRMQDTGRTNDRMKIRQERTRWLIDFFKNNKCYDMQQFYRLTKNNVQI